MTIQSYRHINNQNRQQNPKRYQHMLNAQVERGGILQFQTDNDLRGQHQEHHGDQREVFVLKYRRTAPGPVGVLAADKDREHGVDQQDDIVDP